MSTAGDVADQLGHAVGSAVLSIRDLPGGASRLTSAVEVEDPQTGRRRLVLQRPRGTGHSQSTTVAMEAALLRAAFGAGVPVPRVVAVGEADGLDAGWLVVDHLEGETIARRILRDEHFAGAREHLASDVALALARIHAIDPQEIPGLPSVDAFERPLEILDGIGEVRPVLELGARWLEGNRPTASGRTVVHGDFRMGNFLVDKTGLRGVLDWELAHAGDPAEDIGWLSARAWRFGASNEVGGLTRLDDFLEHYATFGGRVIDEATVRWWQAYASLKWAVICAMQASAHLSGGMRSVELAAIGRRVCESEWDLLGLIDVERPEMPEVDEDGSAPSAPFGRPSARELIEAVTEYLEDKVLPSAEGGAAFEARVARNVLGIVDRELIFGQDFEVAHQRRLEALGFGSDAALATSLRAGELDGRFTEIGGALARSALDQLRVANPSYAA